MRLELTCSACPEQYDVYHGTLKIGYLRLRHGYFRADYLPTTGGERFTVYEAEPQGDGLFEEHEREFYLDEAKKALLSAYTAETKL